VSVKAYAKLFRRRQEDADFTKLTITVAGVVVQSQKMQRLDHLSAPSAPAAIPV